jgi:hypothetical protein
MSLKFGIVARPKTGQPLSGDAYEIVESDGTILVALADGLGSGPFAAQAAQSAMAVVRSNAQAFAGRHLCHHALLGTRVVLALCGLRRCGRVTFAGVGNVGVHYGDRHGPSRWRPMELSGVGCRTAPRSGAMYLGDLFALSTDGISHKFSWNGLPSLDGSQAL